MKSKCILNKINDISTISSKFVVKRINEERLPVLQNHMLLFYILPEDGTKMLFNEIANRWKISKSSLSDIINKYENIGLIKKCVCNEDKRSVYISLTEEAVEIKKKLQNIEAEFLDLLLSDFDEYQREIFEENIDKAIENIKEML